MDLIKLASALIPDSDLKDPLYYEEIFPARNVLKGAEVTRLAPSPTGFFTSATCIPRLPTKGRRTLRAAFSISG